MEKRGAKPKSTKLAIYKLDEPRKQKFMELIEKGTPWGKACLMSGISAMEGANIIDEILKHRRDGVGVFCIAEQRLSEAMECLSVLSTKSGDERIRLMAAAKLGETAFKILVARPFIESQNKKDEIPLLEKNKETNIWE